MGSGVECGFLLDNAAQVWYGTNVMGNNTVKPQLRIAMEKICRGKTVAEAAEFIGVGEDSLKASLRSPAVKQVFDTMLQEREQGMKELAKVDPVLATLEEAAVKGASRIKAEIDNFEDGTPQSRINASNVALKAVGYTPSQSTKERNPANITIILAPGQNALLEKYRTKKVEGSSTMIPADAG